MSNKSQKLYKQCKISRNNSHWVAWLPVDLAVEGKVIVPKFSEPAIVKEVSHKITLTHKQIQDYYGSEFVVDF